MSSKSKPGNQLLDLFASAVTSGVLSPQSSSLLTGHLGAVVVAGAAGKAMEEIEATDVTLVTVLLDASSSIGCRKLENAVRDGYNLLVHTFASSRQQESIMMALWTFNDQPKVVHSYLPVNEAAKLDPTNYRSGGATSLYDTWCDALAANVAYAQQLRDSGTPCRSVVVVITDGEDVSSRRRVGDCARLSRDLLASEQFVLAFVGVGSDVNFQTVARNMGIPDGCITVQANATAQTLHHVFQMVSQSAIRLSRAWVSPGGSSGFFN